MPWARGHYVVTNNDIRIKTDDDFGRYYRWLFHSEEGSLARKLQPPKHGSHIVVISAKIHKRDCTPYLYLNNKIVDFYYDVEGNYGGFTRGFLNFWLDIRCEEAEEIIKSYGFVKNEDFSLLHLTCGNNKYINKL